mmetsp:Transcript_36696/g.84434  ORF Transcript_36696/g.84434 Transcript_36696/m.84434 type:complete len:256 (-) Transcript_36696:516-1283(-)
MSNMSNALMGSPALSTSACRNAALPLCSMPFSRCFRTRSPWSSSCSCVHGGGAGVGGGARKPCLSRSEPLVLGPLPLTVLGALLMRLGLTSLLKEDGLLKSGGGQCGEDGVLLSVGTRCSRVGNMYSSRVPVSSWDSVPAVCARLRACAFADIRCKVPMRGLLSQLELMEYKLSPAWRPSICMRLASLDGTVVLSPHSSVEKGALQSGGISSPHAELELSPSLTWSGGRGDDDVRAKASAFTFNGSKFFSFSPRA